METENNTDNSGYERLEDQINWYDTKSADAKWWHQRTKFFEILCAALIPVAASKQPDAAVVLGILIILLESVQHLAQWSKNWIVYRTTCESLKQEKYSYIAGAGIYDGLNQENAKKLLVERVEALISSEHTKWVYQQERVRKNNN